LISAKKLKSFGSVFFELNIFDRRTLWLGWPNVFTICYSAVRPVVGLMAPELE
jgi:hypothetical protein